MRPYWRRELLAYSLGIGMMLITVALPDLSGRVIDEGLLARDPGQVARLAGLMLALGLVRWVLAGTRRYVSGGVGTLVQTDLRNRLARHLLALEPGYHDQTQTGQLLSRVSADVRAVRYFISFGLMFILLDSLTFVLGAVQMLRISPRLALLALAVSPLLLVAAVRYNRRLHTVYWRVQQETGELTAVVEENAAGVRVVKAFGREDEEERKLEREAREIRAWNLRAADLQGFYAPLLAFLPQLAVALVLAVGGRMVVTGGLSLGDLVGFNLYLLMVATPLQSLGMLFGYAQRAVASASRVFEVLDRAPRITDAPGARPLPQRAGGAEVRLEGVTLRYGDAPQPALENVNLTVPAGGRVALVGATGSGKSSLAALIPRHYQPERGRVLVDGQDVATTRLDSLRGAVAVVHQEPELFSATLRENVAFGRPSATDAEVAAALEAAGAGELLRELPDGLDTVVGEQGYTLSGGQRQRVALARALLTRPRVLVMDDPLAHVDVATEARILAGLPEAIGDATMLLIANRRAALRLADHIVLLDRGRITAEGTHEQLLATEPRYREVLSHQASQIDELVETEAGAASSPAEAAP